MEKEIFEDYFREIPIKIKEFNDSLSKRLVGKWRENEKLENLKLESEWILEKIPANSNEEEYFEFLQPQKAILIRKEGKIYYNYQFYVDNGVNNLVMDGDDKKMVKNLFMVNILRLLNLLMAKLNWFINKKPAHNHTYTAATPPHSQVRW